MNAKSYLSFVFVLISIVNIDSYNPKEKLCANRLYINGTRLINQPRQQALVLGISHLGCQACRNQAVRYNDLHQDLSRRRIHENEVLLGLVNEPYAFEFFPGNFYGKIRIFQDNLKDRLIEKLGHHGQRLNNLIFDKCGRLVYTQRYPQSDIEDEQNYQQLMRMIVSLLQNKQACPVPCV